MAYAGRRCVHRARTRRHRPRRRGHGRPRGSARSGGRRPRARRRAAPWDRRRSLERSGAVGRVSPHARAGSGSTTRASVRPEPAEELALAAIDFLELAVDAPELDARGERQAEVARSLRRGSSRRARARRACAPRRRARTPPPTRARGTRSAPGSGSRSAARASRSRRAPDRGARSRRGRRTSRGCRGRRARGAASSSSARLEDSFHGATRRRVISRTVATGYARSPPRRSTCPRGSEQLADVRIIDEIFDARSTATASLTVDVVSGVGDEVDPHLAAERASRATG